MPPAINAAIETIRDNPDLLKKKRGGFLGFLSRVGRYLGEVQPHEGSRLAQFAAAAGSPQALEMQLGAEDRARREEQAQLAEEQARLNITEMQRRAGMEPQTYEEALARQGKELRNQLGIQQEFQFQLPNVGSPAQAFVGQGETPVLGVPITTFTKGEEGKGYTPNIEFRPLTTEKGETTHPYKPLGGSLYDRVLYQRFASEAAQLGLSPADTSTYIADKMTKVRERLRQAGVDPTWRLMYGEQGPIFYNPKSPGQTVPAGPAFQTLPKDVGNAAAMMDLEAERNPALKNFVSYQSAQGTLVPFYDWETAQIIPPYFPPETDPALVQEAQRRWSAYRQELFGRMKGTGAQGGGRSNQGGGGGRKSNLPPGWK